MAGCGCRRGAKVTAGVLVGAAAVAVAVARRQRRTGEDGEWTRGDPAVLACPHCRGPLQWREQWWCDACGRGYEVGDGIVRFLDASELGPQDRRFAHLYDGFSWFYPAFSRAAFAMIGMTESRGRHEVLDRLQPAGGRVLEVSVGPGSNLPYLVQRADVGEVHGLDISIGQLRRARSLVRRRGWRVPLYLASAEQLPFADASFDAVVHIGGINFFDDRKAALAEMARVAKPGSRIVVVDENERAARGYERTLPGFKSSFAGERPEVGAPIDDLPPGVTDVSVNDVWRGWFYCLEFVTPKAGP